MHLSKTASAGSEGPKGGRPRLQIPRTRFEIECEIVAIAALLLTGIGLAVSWPTLPVRIPRHFNFAGQPDSWGGRNMLLLLEGAAILLYTLLTVLSRYPHIYNYPFRITPENADRQYRLARQLLTALKAGIVCVFAYIEWQTIEVGRGSAANLGIWLLPLLLAANLAIIVHYFIAAYRSR